MAVQTLSESLHHVCAACGGSCQGVMVTLADASERERVRAMGEQLGIAQPVDANGRLAQVNSTCVFLTPNNLCSIHATFGLDAKPAVCKQYPLIATRVGDTVRVGIDPGCYTHAMSWQTGPAIQTANLMASVVKLSESETVFEERILDILTTKGLTLAKLATLLTGEQPPPGQLPPGFVGRCITAASQDELRQAVIHPDTAPFFRENLVAILDHTRTLHPADPPPWPALDPQGEAYALDALSRLVYLRLAHQIPAVAGVIALGTMGVILSAWAAGDRPAFGRYTAAWFRAMRSPAFWGKLLSTAQSLKILLHGPN